MKVGDTVYVVLDENSRTKGLSGVVRVGRKWIYLSIGLRMEKSTMLLDGGGCSTPGRCYMTEQDYLDEVSRHSLWSKLRSGLTRTAPSSVSNDDIKAAMKLLGIAHD